VLRRIKVLLAVIAAMAMMMVVSVPAMADDFGRDCYPFCNDHHNDFFFDDFDRHDDFFLNDFDDFDDDFAELDDCEIVGWNDFDEAIVVCELDF
jgi:hypothetical protein